MTLETTIDEAEAGPRARRPLWLSALQWMIEGVVCSGLCTVGVALVAMATG